MPSPKARPIDAFCALAIGGLDPGGGAGVAADLRAFARARAFGCAVIAVMTVQSTAGMRSAVAVNSAQMIEQAREVLRHQRVRAIKVGALGSAANVRAVASLLGDHRAIPAVVDTPMLPSLSRGPRSRRGRSGARLLDDGAIDAVRASLLPRAALLTVNVAEAEALTGSLVSDLEDARAAARDLCAGGLRAALVKGGHLRGSRAIDVLAIGGELIELDAPRLRLAPVHGTGCTLASLVAGRLALRADESLSDESLVRAVRWAKRVHHRELTRALDVGGKMAVLGLFASRK